MIKYTEMKNKSFSLAVESFCATGVAAAETKVVTSTTI